MYSTSVCENTYGQKALMYKHLGQNAKIYDAKIIHPENLSLGDESIIADYCFIYAVGRGIEIGSFCNITQHSIVQAGGLVKIHDFVGLGPRTTILAATDDYEGHGFIGLGLFGLNIAALRSET